MCYIAADMKYTWWKQGRRKQTREITQDEIAEEDSTLHQRCADRILQFIGTNMFTMFVSVVQLGYIILFNFRF